MNEHKLNAAEVAWITGIVSVTHEQLESDTITEAHLFKCMQLNHAILTTILDQAVQQEIQELWEQLTRATDALQQYMHTHLNGADTIVLEQSRLLQAYNHSHAAYRAVVYRTMPELSDETAEQSSCRHRAMVTHQLEHSFLSAAKELRKSSAIGCMLHNQQHQYMYNRIHDTMNSIDTRNIHSEEKQLGKQMNKMPQPTLDRKIMRMTHAGAHPHLLKLTRGLFIPTSVLLGLLSGYLCPSYTIAPVRVVEPEIFDSHYNNFFFSAVQEVLPYAVAGDMQDTSSDGTASNLQILVYQHVLEKQGFTGNEIKICCSAENVNLNDVEMATVSPWRESAPNVYNATHPYRVVLETQSSRQQADQSIRDFFTVFPYPQAQQQQFVAHTISSMLIVLQAEAILHLASCKMVVLELLAGWAGSSSLAHSGTFWSSGAGSALRAVIIKARDRDLIELPIESWQLGNNPFGNYQYSTIHVLSDQWVSDNLLSKMTLDQLILLWKEILYVYPTVDASIQMALIYIHSPKCEPLFDHLNTNSATDTIKQLRKAILGHDDSAIQNIQQNISHTCDLRLIPFWLIEPSSLAGTYVSVHNQATDVLSSELQNIATRSMTGYTQHEQNIETIVAGFRWIALGFSALHLREASITIFSFLSSLVEDSSISVYLDAAVSFVFTLDTSTTASHLSWIYYTINAFAAGYLLKHDSTATAYASVFMFNDLARFYNSYYGYGHSLFSVFLANTQQAYTQYNPAVITSKHLYSYITYIRYIDPMLPDLIYNKRTSQLISGFYSAQQYCSDQNVCADKLEVDRAAHIFNYMTHGLLFKVLSSSFRYWFANLILKSALLSTYRQFVNAESRAVDQWKNMWTIKIKELRVRLLLVEQPVYSQQLFRTWINGIREVHHHISDILLHDIIQSAYTITRKVLWIPQIIRTVHKLASISSLYPSIADDSTWHWFNTWGATYIALVMYSYKNIISYVDPLQQLDNIGTLNLIPDPVETAGIRTNARNEPQPTNHNVHTNEIINSRSRTAVTRRAHTRAASTNARNEPQPTNYNVYINEIINSRSRTAVTRRAHTRAASTKRRQSRRRSRSRIK